jgi:hypothetical protein
LAQPPLAQPPLAQPPLAQQVLGLVLMLFTNPVGGRGL